VAVLKLPVVLHKRAEKPEALLQQPVWLNRIAFIPNAEFWLPVVLKSNDPNPVAVL
jgi:hypothetical protein